MTFFDKLAAVFLLCFSWASAQTIDHVTPDHLPGGSPDTVITVVGTNLGSINVLWDGVALSTTHINSNVVTAVLPSTDLNAIGTHKVSVVLNSAFVRFRVLTPIIVPDSYTPTIFVPSQDTAITVYGSDFPSNATILFDLQPVATTFVSSTQLQGTVSGQIISTNLPHHVQVYAGAFLGGSVTYVRACSSLDCGNPQAATQQFNLGTISVSAPVLNSVNGNVIRDTMGTVTLGTPWYTITGTDAASFVLGAGNTCVDALVMSPGGGCLFTINNSLTVTSGTKHATLTVFSNATNSPQTIPLTFVGSTAKTLGVSPIGGLSFGSVATGTPAATLNVDLAATFGSFTLSTPFYTLAGSTDFTISNDTCSGGGALPCTFQVNFTPSSAGAKSGTVTINSGADNSPVIALSGTGYTATLHHVVLTWSYANLSAVTGFNIYRAVNGGAFGSALNGGTPVNALTYTDTTPTPGTTYVYGVTAVGAAGFSWAAGTESAMAISSPVTP